MKASFFYIFLIEGFYIVFFIKRHHLEVLSTHHHYLHLYSVIFVMEGFSYIYVSVSLYPCNYKKIKNKSPRPFCQRDSRASRFRGLCQPKLLTLGYMDL